MSKSRMPALLGLTAAGGVGYYLYSAGGDPKVAQKQAEADAHKASAEVRSHLPGRTSQAQKDAESLGAQAGAKADSALGKTQAELAKARAEAEAYAKNAEAYAKDAKASALKKVDELDRKVEAEASKAKSGISSWFGGSK